MSSAPPRRTVFGCLASADRVCWQCGEVLRPWRCAACAQDYGDPPERPNVIFACRDCHRHPAILQEPLPGEPS